MLSAVRDLTGVLLVLTLVGCASLGTSSNHMDLGNAKARQGDDKGAILEFDQVIQDDPNNAVAYNNRANAKKNLGDYAGAISDYDKAIALGPDFAIAYYGRGQAECLLGDTSKGISDFDMTIHLNPEFAPAFLERGRAKVKSGDRAGAKDDFLLGKKKAGKWTALVETFDDELKALSD